MINIHIKTQPILEKTLHDIFQMQADFYVTDISSAHIVITDNSDYKSDVETLCLGVDVFIPTKVSILLKIISAVVTRVKISMPITKGRITLYPEQDIMKIGKTNYTLTDKETNIMIQLINNESSTRENLLQTVWQYDADVNTHTVQTHMYRLKKKCSTDLVITTKDGAYTLDSDL